MKTGVSVDGVIPTRQRSVRLKTIPTTGSLWLEQNLSGRIMPTSILTGTGTETPKQVGQITARLSHVRLIRTLNPNRGHSDDAEE